jgi:hypothetical protein
MATFSKFAPNGKPLSPETTGFQGGGIEGPGFGTAIDANGKVWVTSTGSKTTHLRLMSAFGTKQTSTCRPAMSAFGSKADIAVSECHVCF